MSLALGLRCVNCEKEYPLKILYNCPNCGGILDVFYDKLRGKAGNEKRLIVDESIQGLWTYREYLPVLNKENICSLIEGKTPLIRSKIDFDSFIAEELFFKDETRNPSGSFKDRPTTVAISKAIENGIQGVITASSGNAGTATAAYAAVASLPSIILVPEKVPKEKLMQMFVYGSKIIKVKGDYSNSFNLAKEIAVKCDYANSTSTYYNPYGLEGDKTIAYELFDQLKGLVPKYILVPIGTGPLLTGIYKGYKELKKLGFINKLPRMIGVQAMGCAPIVKAYNEKRNKVEPWDLVDTIASGISDPLKGYSQDGTYTLKTIKNSNGCAISVSDEEILKSVLVLGKQQGLYVEPTSASVIIAYEKLRKMNIIRERDLTVSIITGIGFKDTKPLMDSLNSIPLIEPTFDKFKEIEMLWG